MKKHLGTLLLAHSLIFVSLNSYAMEASGPCSITKTMYNEDDTTPAVCSISTNNTLCRMTKNGAFTFHNINTLDKESFTEKQWDDPWDSRKLVPRGHSLYCALNKLCRKQVIQKLTYSSTEQGLQIEKKQVISTKHSKANLSDICILNRAYMVSTAWDEKANIIDLTQGTAIRTYQLSRPGYILLPMSENTFLLLEQQHMLKEYGNQKLCLWDIRTKNTSVATIPIKKMSLMRTLNTSYPKNDYTFLSGDVSRHPIKEWDLRTNQCVEKYKGVRGVEEIIALHNHNQFLIGLNFTNSIIAWDRHTKQPIQELRLSNSCSNRYQNLIANTDNTIVAAGKNQMTSVQISQ